MLQGGRSLCWAAGMWCHLWREADNHATRTTQLGDVRLKERAHAQTTQVYTLQRSGLPLALPTNQSCMQTNKCTMGTGASTSSTHYQSTQSSTPVKTKSTVQKINHCQYSELHVKFANGQWPICLLCCIVAVFDQETQQYVTIIFFMHC